jgi:PAS domain S-box-containing protein
MRCRLQVVGPDSILLVAEDHTVETRLLQSESKLRSLVDYAAEAWILHDMHGTIVDVNKYAADALGYSRDEMLGMHIAEIEMTVKRGALGGIWNRMEVGKPVTVEGTHRRKDGSTFQVEVRLGLFDNVDEQLMLALARDITDRKAADAALAQANEQLRVLNQGLESQVRLRTSELAAALAQLNAVLENLVDGLVAVDADGVVLVVNAAFVSLGHLRSGELVGRSAADVLPRELTEAVAQCLLRGEVVSAEIELPGQRLGVAVASPSRGPAGGMGAVVLLRDVTFEREVDRMKTDFISTVSHELRTPLTSVLGFAKITMNKLETGVFPHVPETETRSRRAVLQVRGNLQIILTEAERLTLLVNDVLDISKMEAGRLEWKFGAVAPAALVDAAVAATAGLFTDSALTLAAQLDDGLPEVSGDRDRLLQVLINLISNAEKFSTEGVVTVGARLVDGFVEFSVADTGAGIEPGQHEAVFEKFRQVGDTLTNKPSGTGLGLPISKHIVEHHGGRIWVESELGRGARFAFSVPADADAVSEESEVYTQLFARLEAQVAAASPADDSSDILVVDDDPHLREMLRQQLTERGYTVRLAANGFEAIGQVRTRRPDLIVLDVMMPELSGFDVAAMLKNDPSTENIPIIILSILQDIERGYRLGVDRYLTKPTDSAVLGREIASLLARSRSSRKVLIVDSSEPTVSSVGQLLEMRGYTVVGTSTGPELLARARATQPDLIVVERMFEGADAVFKTIRFEKGLEDVYVVILMEPSVGTRT